MNLEINAAGVNKGKAMIELGKLLGIPREEIMAFGDGNNDLKMLKEVGTLRYLPICSSASREA